MITFFLNIQFINNFIFLFLFALCFANLLLPFVIKNIINFIIVMMMAIDDDDKLVDQFDYPRFCRFSVPFIFPSQFVNTITVN